MALEPDKEEDRFEFTRSLEGLETHQRTRTASILSNYLHIDADKLLTAFGRFGQYQMLTYLMCTSVHALFSLNMMVIAFVIEEPPFECNIPNDSGYNVVDQCQVQSISDNSTKYCTDVPGAKYLIPNPEYAITSEYQFLCRYSHLGKLGESMFLLGGMFASPIASQWSDRFGRKYTFLVPLYLSVVINFIASLSPNYTFFIVCRFLCGFACSSFATAGFVLCIESVSSEFRNYVPFFGNLCWTSGYMLAGAMHQLIPEWRWLYRAITLPGLLTIPFIWYLPESLHFLQARRNAKGVKKYVLAAQGFNKTVIVINDVISERVEEPQPRSMIDIFRSPPLMISLALNSFILVVMNFTYWALSLDATDLHSNPMLGYYLSALVEIPGAIIALVTMLYLPRKIVSIVSLLGTGMSLLLWVWVAPHVSPGWSLFFPLAAKFFNTIVWSVQPMIYSESIPTTVRNVFCGIASVIGEAGGTAAPYLIHLKTVYPDLPNVLIGVLSLISALLVVALPETKGKDLTTDIDEYDAGPFMHNMPKTWAGCFNYEESANKAEEATPMVTIVPCNQNEEVEQLMAKNTDETSTKDIETIE